MKNDQVKYRIPSPYITLLSSKYMPQPSYKTKGYFNFQFSLHVTYIYMGLKKRASGVRRPRRWFQHIT